MSAPENHCVANLHQHVGHDFGLSAPVVLDQPRIDHFVLNYGFEKVRFLSPVPSGSAIVARVELAAVQAKGPGRCLVRTKNTVYMAGGVARPVLVAESLAMVP